MAAREEMCLQMQSALLGHDADAVRKLLEQDERHAAAHAKPAREADRAIFCGLRPATCLAPVNGLSSLLLVRSLAPVARLVYMSGGDTSAIGDLVRLLAAHGATLPAPIPWASLYA